MMLGEVTTGEQPAAAAAQRPDPISLLSETGGSTSSDASSQGACLQLSPFAPLQAAQRQPCPGCGRQRHAFCYDCLLPLVEGLPCLELPVLVDIIMHGETNSQASGTHAALLAPSHVTLWRHADGTSHHRRQDPRALQLPEWDPATTAVLFPEGPDTHVIGLHGVLLLPQPEQQQPVQPAPQPPPEQQPREAAEQGQRRCCAFPYERLVILEGSWAKARGLLRAHPALQRLPRVQLPASVRTAFWRRGAGTFRGALDHGVCTIEAVWHLARLLEPGGSWDDLLWLFAYQRERVELQGSWITRSHLAAHIAPLVVQQQQQQQQQQGDGAAKAADASMQGHRAASGGSGTGV